MKSFKQYITEAVPNRSHARVFRQFFNMGKNHEVPFEFSGRMTGSMSPEYGVLAAVFGVSKPKSKIHQMNVPAYRMNFPSFKDDSLGRKQSLKITTIPTETTKSFMGSHNPLLVTPSSSKNYIDLSKSPNTITDINTIGHEAFHSIQTARASVDNVKPFSRTYLNNYDIETENRNYIDAIGNPRQTSDDEYKFNYKKNPHISKLEKKYSGEDIDDIDLTELKYRASDVEHDARLGGAIAQIAYSAGKDHALNGEFSRGLNSYDEFHRLVSPYTDRQTKRTRDAYGRIAQEYQNITRQKINRTI